MHVVALADVGTSFRVALRFVVDVVGTPVGAGTAESPPLTLIESLATLLRLLAFATTLVEAFANAVGASPGRPGFEIRKVVVAAWVQGPQLEVAHVKLRRQDHTCRRGLEFVNLHIPGAFQVRLRENGGRGCSLAGHLEPVLPLLPSNSRTSQGIQQPLEALHVVGGSQGVQLEQQPSQGGPGDTPDLLGIEGHRDAVGAPTELDEVLRDLAEERQHREARPVRGRRRGPTGRLVGLEGASPEAAAQGRHTRLRGLQKGGEGDLAAVPRSLCAERLQGVPGGRWALSAPAAEQQ
mmetsp:Transcript_35920/g.115098  ORF Transcript_35920/g.115098 Transcript_35920/m.115098 type:complete len:294 (-) Transcript_35920:417-1298(-)